MTCKTIKNNVRNSVIVGNDRQLWSWYWVMTEWWWWWRVSAQLKLSLRLTDGGDGQQHSLTLSDPGPDCWTEDKLIFTSLAGLWPRARRMAETDYYICVMWTQKCRNTNTSGYTQYKSGRSIHWVWPLWQVTVFRVLSLSPALSIIMIITEQLSCHIIIIPLPDNIITPRFSLLGIEMTSGWQVSRLNWRNCDERGAVGGGSPENKQAPRSPFIVVNWYPPDSVYF